jgi:SNF2 family DNA or RNA helicase
MSLAHRKSLLPWLYDDVEYYSHQLDGVRQLARLRSFILADDMGLGKSLQALTVATVDVIRGWAEKIIIVCPTTLKGNWQDEIEKFTTYPYLILGQDVHPKTGKIRKLGPVDRVKQLQEFETITGPKILIANYEQMIPHVDDLNKIGFDILIFDEAHYIKNYKAKRTKASLKLNGSRTFLLTGTPMLNHVNELWPLLHKVDPAGYPKYWGFVMRYAVFGGYKNKQIIGVKNEKELTERLHMIMLRRMKKDVLDLPDVQIIQRRVDLAPEQQKIYDKVIDEMILEISGQEDDSEIENALTKFLRLKQICGTTLPFTGEDISSKLDLAVEDAVEILQNGNKLVVFTQFRDVKEAFCRRLDEMAPEFDIWELDGDVPTHERQPTVRKWAAHGSPAAIVCMLQVAGVGLNMTAARHAFFIDKLFVPGMNQQAIDRLHRIGASETQAVQIYEYICRNTIENRVEQILRTKKKLFGSIIDESDFKRKLIQALMERED